MTGPAYNEKNEILEMGFSPTALIYYIQDSYKSKERKKIKIKNHTQKPNHRNSMNLPSAQIAETRSCPLIRLQWGSNPDPESESLCFSPTNYHTRKQAKKRRKSQQQTQKQFSAKQTQNQREETKPQKGIESERRRNRRKIWSRIVPFR